MDQKEKNQTTLAVGKDDYERYAECADFFFMSIEEVVALKAAGEHDDNAHSEQQEKK